MPAKTETFADIYMLVELRSNFSVTLNVTN